MILFHRQCSRHKSRQPRDESCSNSVDLAANIEDGCEDSCLLEDGCEDSCEDGCEGGCEEDWLRSWLRRRMRTWLQTWHVRWLQIRTEEEGATHADAEGTAKCTGEHTTQTSLHTNESVSITQCHSAEDSNKGRRSLALLLLGRKKHCSSRIRWSCRSACTSCNNYM